MRTIALLLAAVAITRAGELHQAARACDAVRMRELISRASSLSEADGSGMTPLHVAIDSRQNECVGLLLKAGADANVRDRQGRTAHDAAAQVPDPRDRSIIVDLLWKSGQRPAPRASTGAAPWTLESSVMRRQTNVTKMLLAMGADPNAIGTGGTTPLADAALKGDVEGVRALLAHGARADAINQSGTQPIHDAALGDSPEVIRELVARGANLNARTRDEAQTPLHVAAAMGKMESVKALVALGADLAVKDSNGRTPVEAAEHAGLTEMAAFLRSVARSR